MACIRPIDLKMSLQLCFWPCWRFQISTAYVCLLCSWSCIRFQKCRILGPRQLSHSAATKPNLWRKCDSWPAHHSPHCPQSVSRLASTCAQHRQICPNISSLVWHHLFEWHRIWAYVCLISSRKQNLVLRFWKCWVVSRDWNTSCFLIFEQIEKWIPKVTFLEKLNNAYN